MILILYYFIYQTSEFSWFSKEFEIYVSFVASASVTKDEIPNCFLLPLKFKKRRDSLAFSIFELWPQQISKNKEI